MSNDSNLNPRQRGLLAWLAAGHKLTEAAAPPSRTVPWTCRNDRTQCKVMAKGRVNTALPHFTASWPFEYKPCGGGNGAFQTPSTVGVPQIWHRPQFTT